MNKKCPSCEIIKPLQHFKKYLAGHYSKFCLRCTNKRRKTNKKYYIKNRDKLIKINKQYIKNGDFKKKMKAKIRAYMIEDLKNNRAFVIDDYIDAIFVEILLNAQNKKCAYCSRDLKTQNYNNYDPLQTSIDRLDSQKPHVKQNICISCLECNLKKRQKTPEQYIKQLNN